MIFKHILFGGFLFATACATTTPNVATLEVMPNFDQGLTRKDFRVIYPGVQGGENVQIKISKQDQELLTFKVPSADVEKQKAYYFGLNSATIGSFEVQVCDGDSKCSSKTSSLGEIPQEKGKVRCPRGRIQGKDEWKEEAGKDIVINISEPGTWLTDSEISTIEAVMKQGQSGSNTHYTEWRKHNVKSNPSYENNVFYTGVNYDMLPYKAMFMTQEAATNAKQIDESGLYVNDFCERKYLLSLHVHLVDTNSKEVKYRFKRTLHMSQGGKQYFIINNTEELKRKVHVEIAVIDPKIKDGTYLVWVSLCTTEKDVVDSTMCSDPVIHDKLTVSASSP